MSKIIPNWNKYLLIVLSFLGFLDAGYLAAEHFLGGVPPCILGTGCDLVTTSQYSVLFGIPLAFIGTAYYFLLFVLSIKLLESNKKFYISLILLISSVGFLASLFFVYLQFFVLNAICTYCMISAITTTLIFISSLFAKIKLNE
jgi:uncharacterized membrane protein